MSEEERAEMIQLMIDNFDFQDEPKLGIFWYDEYKDQLMGVTKIEAMDVPFLNDSAIKKQFVLFIKIGGQNKKCVIFQEKKKTVFLKVIIQKFHEKNYSKDVMGYLKSCVAVG
ncbi:MAG: hypothetical protein LBV69_06575 [Bacteroidales bacterium]|jgi:hypothetical protein|nr:hypothetical protein [Bacteroidales bacterium]